MKVASQYDAATNSFGVTARIDRMQIHDLDTDIRAEMVSKISEALAALYIEKHGSEIMTALNPQAIANMTIAAAGAQINETLNKKMPDKILEVTRTEIKPPMVFQRGILGGIRRVI